MRAYTAPSTQALRGWQRRALVRYLAAKPRDFLAVATPGAGKTTFALRIAGELLADGTVERSHRRRPTEHLKTQWAQAAARRRHRARSQVQQLDRRRTSDGVPRRRRHLRPGGQPPGPAPGAHREPPTLVDVRRDPPRRRRQELGRRDPRGVRRRHPPAGVDRHAVPQRRQRRSRSSPTSATADGLQRSQADHTYGYAEALADGVVRPVVFLAYSGESRWRDSAGEEHAARLGEPLNAEQTARAWRTALNPAGEWMPAVIAAADTRLSQMRQHVPDAGGMIIASDQTAARAYADAADDDHRRGADGGAVRRPGLVGPHHRSSPRAPAAGWSRCAWCPRASTCRGWPSGSTPPARRPRCSSRRRSAGSCGRGGPARRPASSCRRCRTCCSWPARWRRSATTCWASRTASPTGRRVRSSDAEKQKSEPSELDNGFEMLGADAELDQVIFDGSSFGTATPAGSDEEADYLGIPGLLDADQMRDLLRRRQEEQLTEAHAPGRRQRRAACRRHHARPAARTAHASSTRWCRWPTTAPASRTAGFTTSCAGSAAARWLRPPRQLRTASRRSAIRSAVRTLRRQS